MQIVTAARSGIPFFVLAELGQSTGFLRESKLSTPNLIASTAGKKTEVNIHPLMISLNFVSLTLIGGDEGNMCQDTSKKFEYNNSMMKTCKWISMKTNPRCNKPGAKENGPVTCGADTGTDCTCYDSKKFKLNGKTRTCVVWAAKNIVKRCKKNTVRSECPLICNIC
jgi:hypothetical protein